MTEAEVEDRIRAAMPYPVRVLEWRDYSVPSGEHGRVASVVLNHVRDVDGEARSPHVNIFIADGDDAGIAPRIAAARQTVVALTGAR